MTEKTTKTRVTGRRNGHEPETAKEIAGHLLRTPEDKIVETTYIPMRLVHVLSLLQALEGQYDKLQVQVSTIEDWRREKLGLPAIELDPDTEEKDSPSHNLFIHKFRFALSQHYRGKDGKFVELMSILADTDLQTRGTNFDDVFRHQVREQ